MEKKRKIRIGIIITLLVAVLAASGYYLWQEMGSRAKEKKDFERIQQLVDGENGRNLALLMEQNSDCIGWVCIPETTLDYPVMHTPDNNQKYLKYGPTDTLRSFSKTTTTASPIGNLFFTAKRFLARLKYQNKFPPEKKASNTTSKWFVNPNQAF